MNTDPNRIRRTPLHKQIAEIMRKEILVNYNSGDRIDTEPVPTKKFGVSVLTIRGAVLELCSEGFLEKIQGSGTYVQDIRKIKHVAILSDLEINHEKASYFHSRLFRKLQQYFEEREIPVRAYIGKRRPWENKTGSNLAMYQAITAEIEKNHVSAILAIATPPHQPWFGLAQKNNISLLGTKECYDYYCKFDHPGMIENAVQILVSEGRKKIAVLAVDLNIPWVAMSAAFKSSDESAPETPPFISLI